MPRPNPGRELYAEEHLAQRIQAERERLGWSYEGLAKRMAAAGCPVDQSAIYKIERQKPRRRITVDELVGLSKVFEIDVADLLVAPEIAAVQEVRPLVGRFFQLRSQLAKVTRENHAEQATVLERLSSLTKDHPAAKAAVEDLASEIGEIEASQHDPEGRLGQWLVDDRTVAWAYTLTHSAAERAADTAATANGD
jgi:transcriptional regulator with XRE-family HTH domain